MSHNGIPPCWRKTGLVKKHIKTEMSHFWSTHLCHSDDESLLSQWNPRDSFGPTKHAIPSEKVECDLEQRSASILWNSVNILYIMWVFFCFLLVSFTTGCIGNTTTSLICIIIHIRNITGRTLTQNREKFKLANRFFSLSPSSKTKSSYWQIWRILAPSWLHEQCGKQCVEN